MPYPVDPHSAKGRSWQTRKSCFRRQKRRILKNSTYFTFYVGHSTRQAISILRVSNVNSAWRSTATHITTTSFSSTTTDSDITTAVVSYFENCFPKQIAAPQWTPAAGAAIGAAPLFHKPRSSDTWMTQFCRSKPVIVGLCVAWSSQTATCISMASSNFISADVLDISRKATPVKERADFIGRLHCSTQNPRLSSCKLYCK